MVKLQRFQGTSVTGYLTQMGVTNIKEMLEPLVDGKKQPAGATMGEQKIELHEYLKLFTGGKPVPVPTPGTGMNRAQRRRAAALERKKKK